MSALWQTTPCTTEKGTAKERVDSFLGLYRDSRPGYLGGTSEPLRPGRKVTQKKAEIEHDHKEIVRRLENTEPQEERRCTTFLFPYQS